MNKTFSQVVKAETIENVEKNYFSAFLLGVISNFNISEDKTFITLRNEELINLLFKKITANSDFKISKEKSKIIFDSEELAELSDSFTNKMTKGEIESYISGLFVSRGYVNHPGSKYYHLEIRLNNIESTIDIVEILSDLGISSKFNKKGNWFYLYIKKGAVISDFLKMIKAYDSMFVYEDERITRIFKSELARANSISVNNIKKIVESSERQCIKCNEILDNQIKYNLTIQQRRLAKLRIENPELSLQELADLYNKEFLTNFSKSAINHWMRRIMEVENG